MICKSKVAIVGDIHLGVHLSSNTWHEIGLNFAQWLRETLYDKGIQDIIFLGDIIHNRNEVSVTTLHVLCQFFKQLEDFNIIIITGNHDCYYSERSDVHSIGTLNDWKNIEVVDRLRSVHLFGKTLTFCPWNTSVTSIPKSDIVFGHFEINTFKMNGPHVCENGIDSSELLEKSPLILTGHFHCTDDRNYKNGRILYAGSPYEQSWGEYGDPKGIYTLDINTSALEFIPNTKSPKHVKIRLSELLAVGKITENFKKEFAGNIINFIVDTEIEQKAVDTLLAKFYALNPISIKTEYILPTEILVDTNEEIKFEGVNTKQDIIEFTNNLEAVDNKETLIKYLVDVFEKCNEDKHEG